MQPWEARERRARGEAPPQFFLDTKEQPYLTPEGKPFELIRVWGHGGKTNVWGRVSLRYSDLDFKGPATDGWEIPWPICVHGRRAVLRQGRAADRRVRRHRRFGRAARAASSCCPPPAPRCGERLLRKAFGKVNMPIVPGRRANRTKPLNGFPACHYCGNCGAGCDTASFFCSADHLLPSALKTGRLEIRSNAVVGARARGRATASPEGVQYFDRKTGTEHQVYGKVVVMGASAVDTTRILLNSKSDQPTRTASATAPT